VGSGPRRAASFEADVMLITRDECEAVLALARGI
jgi:hypothetical protein